MRTNPHPDEFVQSMIAAAHEAETQGRFQEMEVFARKAYEKYPDDQNLAWPYARALRLNGHVEQAMDVLTPYTVREGVTASIYIEYASVLLAKGQVAQARDYAAKAVKTAPQLARSWNVAGVSADASGDHETAQSDFKKALSLIAKGDERMRSVVLNNLALSLAAQGKTAEAEGVIAQAMTGAQYYPQIRVNHDALSGWAEIARSHDVPEVTIEPAAGDAVKAKKSVKSVPSRAPAKKDNVIPSSVISDADAFDDQNGVQAKPEAVLGGTQQRSYPAAQRPQPIIE